MVCCRRTQESVVLEARIAFSSLVLFALVGCASGAARFAEPLPGSRLSEMRRFYVQHQPNDPRDIHLLIQQELRALGMEADAGAEAPNGADYDAIVTYLDRYIWDMSMYCLQLTLYFRDTRTGYVTATGWSFRPSMVRKTPQGHAHLILTELFGRSAE
jgi:hypothetical protein